MKSRQRFLLRVVAILLVTIAALWLLKIAISSVGQIHWKQLNLALIGAALVTSVLQECVGSAIAQTALAAFRQPASFCRLLVITTIATATNSMVPVPAGIPARVWMQKSLVGIPIAISTSAIVLETLSGYGTLALFALAGGAFFGTTAIASGMCFAPAVLVFACLPAMGIWAFRKQIAVQLKRHANLRPAFVPAAATVALNVVVIALATLRLWLILRAAGHDVVSIFAIVAALSIARIAGVASMIPMGLGSRDVTLTGLLVLATMPAPIAILAATIDRVVSTLPYVTIALVGWPLLRHCDGRDRPREPR